MSVPEINGTPVSSLGGSSNPTVLSGFSTTGPGMVLVFITVNTASVTSITGAGLTFASRASAGSGFELWYADSLGAISGEALTINISGATGFITAVAFGVGNQSGFDANASLPDTINSDIDGLVSTDAADTMVIGGWRNSDQEDTTAPDGWTEILTAGYTEVYYKTFTSPQTNLTVPRPASTVTNGGICDAIAGTGGGEETTTLFPIWIGHFG